LEKQLVRGSIIAKKSEDRKQSKSKETPKPTRRPTLLSALPNKDEKPIEPTVQRDKQTPYEKLSVYLVTIIEMCSQAYELTFNNQLQEGENPIILIVNVKELVAKYQQEALESWNSAFEIANASKSVSSIVKVLKNVKSSITDLFHSVTVNDPNKGDLLLCVFLRNSQIMLYRS
jgi:hypothetical protein